MLLEHARGSGRCLSGLARGIASSRNRYPLKTATRERTPTVIRAREHEMIAAPMAEGFKELPEAKL